MGDNIERICLQTVGCIGAPSYDNVRCLKTYDGRVDVSRELRQRCILRIGEVVTLLPVAEILVNDGDGLVGIEVAGQADSYIVRNIIPVKIVLDIRDGRVLQMLLGTDRRLCAVGVMREEFLA